MYQWIIVYEILCWNTIKDTSKAGQHHADIKDRFVDNTE